MNLLILLTAVLAAGVLAFLPALRRSRAWTATVTPLASIMGSGFLVSAPLVATVAGVYAPLAMAGLLAVAFGIGGVIRFNIKYAEPLFSSEDDDGEHSNHQGHADGTRNDWVRGAPRRVAGWFEQASHIVLAGAYVVSVSYYLQLLSAFVLDQLGVSGELYQRLATTGVLALITLIGTAWGLRALEKVETWAVSLNLGTIAALLVGLLVHDVQLASAGEMALPSAPSAADPVHSARVMMGLLIVVQGFETSRFLGAEHPREERVRTMRWAQLIASAIYLTFVALMLPLLSGEVDAEVTAIVALVGPVATVLPMLIVVAAVGSQFSAAVADDAGCSGLVSTIVNGRLSARWVYGGIGLAAIGLTWLTNVLSIISVASRAFALFYALQCGVAFATALTRRDVRHRPLWLLGAALAGSVALGITLFGIPAE